jgi:hypothetical protein
MFTEKSRLVSAARARSVYWRWSPTVLNPTYSTESLIIPTTSGRPVPKADRLTPAFTT